jgi:hypothetical protein
MVRPAMFALSLLTALLSCAVARADPARALGVSIGLGIEADFDDTVTSAAGDRLHDQTGQLTASALANMGDFALGGLIVSHPEFFGDGRALYGARAGWQPRFGPVRFQVLGEAGLHRFTNVGAGLFSSSTPKEISGPYLGLALGTTGSFGRSVFEWGAMLVARRDLFRGTATKTESSFLGSPVPPPTTYDVGGTLIGAVLTIGLRFADPG